MEVACRVPVLALFFLAPSTPKKMLNDLRNEIVNSKQLNLGCYLHSILDYDSIRQTAKFWMDEKKIEFMKKNGWYVLLVRTDGWVSVSPPVFINDVKVVEN